MCTPSAKAHFVNRIATLFTSSHVHTSISWVCLIHAIILQVKHHVNWFTSRSSIASSNVHISFTLADPIQTVPPMQFIPAYHFHKCKPCSQVHIHFLHTHAFQLFSRLKMCTSRYTTKDIWSYHFRMCSKRSKSFLRNLVRSRPIFSWRF